jgi:hypothetical protein
LVKDSIAQINEDRKIFNDISWMRRKIESLTAAMMNIKSNDESPNATQSNRMMASLDSGKHLEASLFNEFQKSYNREIDWLRKIIDESRKDISNLYTSLKSKAEEKIIKEVEEQLLLKLEELRQHCNKKFADKIETHKTLKYLDVQVKHIIDVYIKKMERGDNWMLAKKPIGGYTCASCESYIGDLNENNNQFIAWNKYPQREKGEHSYRVLFNKKDW